MKSKVVLIGAAVLVAAAVACYFWFYRSGENEGTIRVSGNIEITTVELSFKVPGRVRERLVDEGETVSAGQTVARLDPEDLRHEVAIRGAEVEAARAALSELETGYRKEEIAQAEAVLRRIEAEAERIRVDFGRQQRLYRKGVVSGRDYDASRAAYEASQASVREARERLNLLRSGPRRETIAQARARLREAEAALGLAKTRLGYTELLSPVAGFVLSKNIEPGEQVAAGTPVITVGMLDDTWVRAYIGESELGRVKLGQPATVTTDSFPGKKYPGTVSFISQEAEFTPRSVQTEKERVKLVYRIKVLVPNRERELKPGMPADVEIQEKAGDGR